MKDCNNKSKNGYNYCPDYIENKNKKSPLQDGEDMFNSIFSGLK